MVYYPKKEYELIGFEKSHLLAKKYDAVLENKKTKKIVRIPFGSRIHGQYFDKIGLYTSQDHLDERRRQLYKIRHQNDINKPYSPSWFSLKFLW